MMKDKKLIKYVQAGVIVWLIYKVEWMMLKDWWLILAINVSESI